MANQEPTVEILMAVYNGEKYLSEMLDSILGQTYSNWRLVIADDFSSDNSLQIIKRYSSLDSRISSISFPGPSGSAKNNFFRLISVAHGPYVMFADQDDVWASNKIELEMEDIAREEKKKPGSPLLVCTDLIVVDENLNTINDSFSRYSNTDITCTELGNIVAQNVATGCTTLVNDKLLYFLKQPVNIDKVMMHDWYAAIIAGCFGGVHYLKVPTVKYRQHGDNSAGAIKYSISSKLGKEDKMRDNLIQTMNQAGAVVDAVGPLLPEKSRTLLLSYSKILERSPLKRYQTLSHFGIWKSGIVRRFAQAYLTLTFPK